MGSKHQVLPTHLGSAELWAGSGWDPRIFSHCVQGSEKATNIERLKAHQRAKMIGKSIKLWPLLFPDLLDLFPDHKLSLQDLLQLGALGSHCRTAPSWETWSRRPSLQASVRTSWARPKVEVFDVWGHCVGDVFITLLTGWWLNYPVMNAQGNQPTNQRKMNEQQHRWVRRIDWDCFTMNEGRKGASNPFDPLNEYRYRTKPRFAEVAWGLDVEG